MLHRATINLTALGHILIKVGAFIKSFVETADYLGQSRGPRGQPRRAGEILFFILINRGHGRLVCQPC